MGSFSKTQRFMKGAKDRTIRAEEIHTRMPHVLHKTLGVGEGGATTLFYSYGGLMLDQIDSYDLISAKLC